MTDAEYKKTQDVLVLVAGIIAPLDLDGFLARIARAASWAPIIDPTLYRAGMDKLEQVERIAVAARHFQAEVHRQQERAINAGIKQDP